MNIKQKTIGDLRREMGVTPPSGRAEGEPTYLMHLAFRMNEKQARAFIKSAQELGISESLYGRMAILEKVKSDGNEEY